MLHKLPMCQWLPIDDGLVEIVRERIYQLFQGTYIAVMIIGVFDFFSSQNLLNLGQKTRENGEIKFAKKGSN